MTYFLTDVHEHTVCNGEPLTISCGDNMELRIQNGTYYGQANEYICQHTVNSKKADEDCPDNMVQEQVGEW